MQRTTGTIYPGLSRKFYPRSKTRDYARVEPVQQAREPRMNETDHLRLPYIMAAQAQKHVTHNEALRTLDAVVQLSVLDRDLATAPASPVEGDRYIIASGATGAWVSHDLELAAYQDGAWMFHAPQPGWIAWIEDEAAAMVWDGSVWASFGNGGSSGTGSVQLLGINATADTTNRLKLSSPASLFDHEGGDHQLKVNKDTATDTASLLFQTGYSGRAEMGTAGDDDFHFKVSHDGSNWSEAIVINRSTGEVTFPNTTLGGGGGSGDASMSDVLRNAIAIADLKGSALGLDDGIADAFDNEDNVDSRASSNQSYDVGGDFYAPSVSASSDLTAGKTASATSEYSATFAASKAIDDTNSTTWSSANLSLPIWLKADLGSGSEEAVNRVAIRARDTLPGHTPKTFTIEGSNNDSDWTVLETISNETGWSASEKRTYDFSNATAYRYFRIHVTAIESGSFVNVAELELITVAPQDMTLVSDALTAEATPAQAYVQAFVKPIDPITINTDFIMEVSRDGGTTWTAATLVEKQTFSDGTKMFEDDNVSLASQPSGTSMKWRVRTLNGKNVEVTGVVLKWSS